MATLAVHGSIMVFVCKHADDSKRHYGWLRWNCSASVAEGKSKVEIICRATSADGVTQPIVDRKHHTYLYNGCHTIDVNVRE